MPLLLDWCDHLRIYWDFLNVTTSSYHAAQTAFLVAFGSIYALLLLSHGYTSLLFLALGFLLATVFGRSEPIALQPSQTISPLPSFASWESDDAETEVEFQERYQILNLSFPSLLSAVDRLLGHILQEYVLSWWRPLNTHHSMQFETAVRTRLNAAVSNLEKMLLKQDRNDIVMSSVYGVANALIIHMRECRAFEDSGMSLEAYTLHNPQSPFAQMLSIEEQQQQLRGLTNTVIKRLLPPADIASPLVCILLKELLSTHLFGNILESCSDPDFINSQIIDHLSEQENTMEESMNPTLGDLDGFRSVVEKATEEAIALEDHSPSPIQELPQELPPAPHPASPPCTPRPQRSAKTNVGYTKEGTTRPSSTTATIEHTSPGSHDEVSSRPTVDTSIKTRSEEEEAAAESPMLYPRGTVLFSVMDISERRASTGLPDKNKLAFIIQIERPAMHGQPGSEGGGYVITRNYTDFEVFQSIMAAKHPKHVARLNLRLPLDASRSWLKSATTAPTNDAEAMSRSLEKYLHTVVQDSELGRDQTITAFLRKERRNDQDADSLTFADEYRDQINAYAALAEKQTHASPTSGVGRAMSLFSRGPARHQPTTTTADAGALDPLHPEDATTTTTTSTHSPTEPSKRWFKRKSTREGSISSLWSSNSSSKEDTEDEHDFKEFQESTIPEESDTSPSVSSMTTSLETLPTAATTPLKINPAIVPTPSPEAPISLEASTPADKPRKKTSLSAVDVELLIETTFALVVEIFDLTRTNNKAWMRRSLLNLLREIVRRSYTEIIAKGYDDYMNEYLSPDAIAQLIDKINDQYWPTENNDNSKKSSSSSRSIEEKEKCRRQARMMLMNRAIPGGLRQLIGDQNCSAAMDRLWRRCQNPELNRILMLQILERIMRPIFV